MPQLVRIAPLVAILAGGAGVALAAVGCSALVSLDGLSTGAADGASSSAEAGSAEGGPSDSGGNDSASSTDGATADGAKDAGDDGVAPDPHVGPNLLASDNFESGCTWNGFQGTATTDSTTARTGTKSCRVCTDPATTDYFTIGQFSGAVPVIGDTYHATAWVRTAPGAATPPGGAVLFLRTSTQGPFVQVEQASTNPAGLPLTSAWQRMEITLKPTKAASQLDVYIGASTTPGACFLVDDVWLEKLTPP